MKLAPVLLACSLAHAQVAPERRFEQLLELRQTSTHRAASAVATEDGRASRIRPLGDAGAVSDLAFSSDGRWLAIAGQNVTLIDLAAPSQRTDFAGPARCAPAPDGTFHLVAKTGVRVIAHDGAGFRVVRKYSLGKPMRYEPLAAAVSPDGARLAYVDAEDRRWAVDLTSGTRHQVDAGSWNLDCMTLEGAICWEPHGNCILSASNLFGCFDEEGRLLLHRPGAVPKARPISTDVITSAEFLANGNLVTAEADYKRVHGLPDRQPLHFLRVRDRIRPDVVLAELEAQACWVTVMKSGTVVTHDGKKLDFRDAKSLRPFARFDPKMPIGLLALSHGGNKIAVASGDRVKVFVRKQKRSAGN